MTRTIRTLLALALVSASHGVLAQYSTPYRDVDNPDRFPYQATVHFYPPTSVSPATGTFSIPAQKRVVAEFVAVQCFNADPTATFPTVYVYGVVAGTAAGYQTVTIPLPPLKYTGVDPNQGRGTSSTSTPIKLYADDPAGFGVVVYPARSVPATDCNATLTGHVVTP